MEEEQGGLLDGALLLAWSVPVGEPVGRGEVALVAHEAKEAVAEPLKGLDDDVEGEEAVGETEGLAGEGHVFDVGVVAGGEGVPLQVFHVGDGLFEGLAVVGGEVGRGGDVPNGPAEEGLQ